MSRKSRYLNYVLLVLITYFVLRLKRFEHKASVIIDGTQAIEVWEFVADFSNMKYLNPTIVDFNIIEEAGNYDHWKYAVQYTENLSHWPYLQNEAIARFNVQANRGKDLFFIRSEHETCFTFGLYCLKSDGEFRFSESKKPGASACEETVTYQCPTIFGYFCRKEVEYQRTAIIENLKKHFLNRKI